MSPRALYRLPGDGDEDLLGELATTCEIVAPALAAISRHEGVASAHFLYEDGPAPAFAVLLQALARPLAEFCAAYSEFWERLEEHRRRPGPRRGDDWRPTPDLVPPLRTAIRLLKSLPWVLLPTLKGAEVAADAAQRALSALDLGVGVFDENGNVVLSPKEKP